MRTDGSTRILGIGSGGLHDIITGKNRSGKGYLFCYKEDYEPGKYKRIPHKVDPRPVMQYTLDGEYVREWKSMSEAAEYITGNRKRGTDIGTVCRGLVKKALGYKWKYKENDI